MMVWLGSLGIVADTVLLQAQDVAATLSSVRPFLIVWRWRFSAEEKFADFENSWYPLGRIPS